MRLRRSYNVQRLFTKGMHFNSTQYTWKWVADSVTGVSNFMFLRLAAALM